MKKKLTALLCTLCMAVALCATAFAKAATPTMTATATLSEDKKQVKVVLSLSGMDGNYTYLTATWPTTRTRSPTTRPRTAMCLTR